VIEVGDDGRNILVPSQIELGSGLRAAVTGDALLVKDRADGVGEASIQAGLRWTGRHILRQPKRDGGSGRQLRS
jgi:hypothetical protein